MRNILTRIARAGCVLMFDFDGTLSPIVADPRTATISPSARRSLVACVRKFPVVVISGRALSDVRRRVGIRGVWYAGNHGLERSYGSVHGRARISPKVRSALRTACRALSDLMDEYPGLRVHDKRLSLSVHVRNVRTSQLASLRRDVRAILTPLGRQGIEFKEGQEYIYNVRPKDGPHKGGAARMACAQLPRRFLPVFIGDDATDEDAFRVLKRGITIRVGKSRGSVARYYMRRRVEVDRFLSALAGA